jgi:uncharacterized protein
MVQHIPVSFKNHKGLTLRGVVHVPKQYDTAIVYLHGFPSSMESSPKYFCTALAKHNYLCFRFNFSGTATSEGKYENKRMSEEVKDIRAAIDFLTKHYPTKKLILVGHSTGAIDAALYAHADKRISGLVLAGAVSYLDQAVNYDFTARQIRDFWQKGFTHHPPPAKRRPGSWIPNNGKLNRAFYDEFFTLDLIGAIKQYHRPLLILHGEKDEGIPSHKDPHELYALANNPKKLVMVKGASHSFKPKRPAAVKAILSFVRQVHR